MFCCLWHAFWVRSHDLGPKSVFYNQFTDKKRSLDLSKWRSSKGNLVKERVPRYGALFPITTILSPIFNFHGPIVSKWWLRLDNSKWSLDIADLVKEGGLKYAGVATKLLKQQPSVIRRKCVVSPRKVLTVYWEPKTWRINHWVTCKEVIRKTSFQPAWMKLHMFSKSNSVQIKHRCIGVLNFWNFARFVLSM